MKFGNRIYTDSPSKALINELGALNMTAEELTRVLDQLKLERVLMYLKKYGKFFQLHKIQSKKMGFNLFFSQTHLI